MKRTLMALLGSAMVFAACESSNDPGIPAGSGQVSIVTEMDNSLASGIADAKSPDAVIAQDGERVDSLSIRRVRVLISRVKLHRSEQDSVTGDRDVKLDPISLDFDSAGSKVVMSGVVPPGEYDRVKFEFHKLSSSDLNRYRGDTVFGVFVEPDRATIIIDGTKWKNGAASAFRYRSDVTLNLSLRPDQNFTVAENQNTDLVLTFRPLPVFVSGGVMLDPSDRRNEPHIDNMIKAAFRVLRHRLR